MNKPTTLVLSLSAAAVVALLPACKPSQSTGESPASSPTPMPASSPTPQAPSAASSPSEDMAAPDATSTSETVSTIELEDPVAVVNGEPISRAELQEAFASAIQMSGANADDLTDAQKMEGYRQLLHELIMDKLVTTAAADVVVSDADVDAEIAKIKKQFPSEEEFNKQIEAAGQSPEKLKKSITKMLQQQKWMEEQVGDKAVVTDAETKAFYDKNKADFQEPDMVRASHILIRVDKDASDEVVKEKLAIAKKAEARAEKGEDFAALAKELSEEPGAKQSGGDLGFFTEESMVPEFSKVAFSEKEGEISEPVRTQFGWHVIKVTGIKAARTVPYEEVKAKLTEYLKADKQRTAVQALLKSMLAKAKIKNTLPAAPPASTAPMPGVSAPDAATDAAPDATTTSSGMDESSMPQSEDAKSGN